MVIATYGHYGQRASRIGPGCIRRSDFPHPIQFRFSREGSYCAKPTQIRSGWPGQSLAKRIWSGSKPVCRNQRARFLAIHNRPRYQFPHFQARFCSSTDVPDNIVQSQPGSDLVLADCVRFWPNGSGPEANQCARMIRPTSGQCFPTDPDRMRIGSSMFTGVTLDVVLWSNLPSLRSSHIRLLKNSI